MKTKSNIQKIVISAMFAALTCVATMLIKVPVPATNGYLNLGDGIVILSGWLLGGIYGTAAAGIGSMLADILLAYPAYAPGTLIIKAVCALVAFAVYKMLSGKSHSLVIRIVSATLAEVCMVLGYFIYESLLLGYGLGAALSIVPNMIQGAGGIIISVAVMELIKNNRYTQKIQKL